MPGAATPGADWARGARPGDVVGLLGPGGGGARAGPGHAPGRRRDRAPRHRPVPETLPAGTMPSCAWKSRTNRNPAAPLARHPRSALSAAGRRAARLSSLLDAAIAELDLTPHLGTLRAFIACEQAEARRIRPASRQPGCRRIAGWWRPTGGGAMRVSISTGNTG